MEYTPNTLNGQLLEDTESILFPDDPTKNPNHTEGFYYDEEEDNFLGLGNKQKRAQKKLAKAQKQLAKGNVKRAERKLSKAEKIMGKAGISSSNPQDTTVSRIAEDVAAIQFNKNAPQIISQQQKSLQDALTQQAISQAQESVGQIGAAAGGITPYSDNSGLGTGGDTSNMGFAAQPLPDSSAAPVQDLTTDTTGSAQTTGTNKTIVYIAIAAVILIAVLIFKRK